MFHHGKISKTISNKLEMIGIETEIIIILPPISILFAIAVSPAISTNTYRKFC